MYKVLIGKDNITQQFQKETSITYTKRENLLEMLEYYEYDLIYIDYKYRDNQIEKIVFKDYMILPKCMSKLIINNDIDNTFINLNFVNLLIRKNVEVIEFKDYLEEIVLSSIIKEMLNGQSNEDIICDKIYATDNEIKYVKRIINGIISRHYAVDSKIRKVKYILYKQKIKNKFFNNILNNINNDIIEMAIL